MRWGRVGVKTVLNAYGGPGRCIRASCLRLSLAGALVSEGVAVAQPLPLPIAQRPAHLTVRPRTMAKGTRTARAGWHPLDSLPGSAVYVPQACVGTRRCPLTVFPLQKELDTIKTLMVSAADQYGMVLLTTALASNDWADAPSVRTLDAALRQTLRAFAIAPDQLALVGFGTGSDLVMGGATDAVFSRIVWMFPNYPWTDNVGPPHQTTKFLVYGGLNLHPSLVLAQELRRGGHRVKLVLTPGQLTFFMSVAPYEFIGRWLRDSWTRPNPAARPAPSIAADSLPVLTPEALAKLAAFWVRFQQEPDSIQTTARLAYQHEVTLPLGKSEASLVIVDMPALAARYPSVAAALQAAGLTARQHDAYRVALISASVTGGIKRTRVGPLDPASALGKNIEFLYTHSDALAPLWETAMWTTP